MREASESEIEEFVSKVKELFGDRLDRVVLYGSYARGEQLPGSDVDLAVILKEEREDDREKLLDLRSDYLIDDEIYFSPRIFEKEEFEKRVEENYSFYTNVDEEGVEV